VARLLLEPGTLEEPGRDELLPGGGVDGKGLGTMLELGRIDEPSRLREQAAQPLITNVAASNKATAARKNRFRFILPLRLGTFAGTTRL